MRHVTGCDCEKCAGTSTSDTVLVGLLMILGVVLAITTASRLVVAISIALLILLVVAKLRFALFRPGPDKTKRRTGHRSE